jgi:hypothetical protein
MEQNNLYAINCLQIVIDTHQAEIKRLKNEGCVTTIREVFNEEETKERQEYVKQLKKAIQLLSLIK